MRIPDVAGYAVGWRTWTTGNPALPPCLSSLRGDRWPHRTPLIAGCRANDVPPSFDPHYRTQLHNAPEESCTCGIYALRTELQLFAEDLGGPAVAPMMSTAVIQLSQLRSVSPILAIIGKVALWGKVIEHTEGFRAEYAYPLELWALDAPQALVTDLHFGYGVPVRRVSTGKFLSTLLS